MENHNPLTEIQIIERIIQGEKQLYELIIRRYNPTLYQIGRSYSYNHEDTQDLMQESFIDAYKNLHCFEGRSSFKTWIMRIMLNQCYRKRQKFSYKNEITANVNESAIPMFSSNNNDIEKVVRRKELSILIEEALTEIPLEYRMVFTLREINGMNTAETAKLLDISESNVKVRLNRSKAMLRKEIEKSYTASDLYEFNLIYCDAIVNRVMQNLSASIHPH